MKFLALAIVFPSAFATYSKFLRDFQKLSGLPNDYYFDTSSFDLESHERVKMYVRLVELEKMNRNLPSIPNGSKRAKSNGSNIMNGQNDPLQNLLSNFRYWTILDFYSCNPFYFWDFYFLLTLSFSLAYSKLRFFAILTDFSVQSVSKQRLM